MATVKGTGAADFIHRARDGNLPPPGFNEVVGVTTGDKVCHRFYLHSSSAHTAWQHIQG